jgi:hypothetical protein
MSGGDEMARVKVGLENMSVIDDGLTVRLFNRELKKVVADCTDRPQDKSVREVTLKVRIVPQCVDGVCETVLMETTVTSKTPAPRTKMYQVAVKGDDQLIANPASLDDAHQRTLDEERG